MMTEEFKFGKKILNTLTTGMYKNALFIFREYIQNAADAVDDAIELGLMDAEDFQIDVQIDRTKRQITIVDNATGIQHKKVLATLGNIGDSQKDPKKKKGFIGIGRLGGLGYCRKMIFETSYDGEDVKTISEWDAARIREMLHDPNILDDAQSVLRQTVVFNTEPCEKSKHYFKVTMLDVTEENEDLLDFDKVFQYLQMVAPTDFDYADFPFKKKIHDFVKENRLPAMNEYKIFLNNTKVSKGYQETIKTGNPKAPIQIEKVQCGLIREGSDVLGWYWYGITAFSGTLEKYWQSGLRLRKGNIQIGEDDCLVIHKLWRERRGNYYFFGEVHALDPDLIPNGRRDYFEEDGHCRRFEAELAKLFSQMLDLVYDASRMRSAVNKIEATKTQIKTLQDKVSSGLFSDTASKKKAVRQLEGLKGQFTVNVENYTKLKDKLTDKADNPVIGNAVSSIVSKASVDTRPVKVTVTDVAASKTTLVTDNLSREQKSLLELMKDVLSRNLPPEEFQCIWDELLKKIKSL